MPRRVLIVDDCSDTHELVKVFLESHGYAVTAAGTAHEAIMALFECDPHTILLDYRVPGLTPEGFVALARDVNPYIPIILMSAIDDIGRLANRLGCQYYVKKPFDIEALPPLIEAACVKA